MEQQYIRNFCIIAHIDHGKSTLADRLLESTSTIGLRDMKQQILDSLDLERERGITIKLVPVKMNYTAKDGREYVLNLIDTPGHVDFGYEVSRSLAACEGALLVVDATQGVEAQTLANAYMAVEQGLEIIPVINKIDLPSSRPDYVIREIEDVVGLDCDHVILASAKEGKGIDDILERVVEKVPAPLGDREAPLQAMIFDSVYDNYKGVICYIRVVNGRIRAGQTIRFMATGGVFPVEEVGVFRPGFQPCDELAAGEVGYVVSNIKTVAEAHTGDTITDNGRPAASPLPGYRKVKPVVFCGFYPVERDDYPQLRDALEKLTLNDSSINFEPETSVALGFGFRCGFLGLLHMDVSKERLRREFGVELVATAPNVVYEVVTKDGGLIEAHRPSDFPEIGEIQEVREPVIKISLFVPTEYVGKVMKLCQDKRGTYISMDYLAPDRVRLMYELPLAEFIIDFHDKLKSQTRGYASLDYEFTGLKAADLVRVDVLVSGEAADAFSFICHRDSAYHRGQAAVRKLKELIPSQLFEVPIQASVGKKVIVRQNVKALRKDVLAKCYGGDITRKRKLLEKQKEGKKRMKQIGKVSIPQEAFLAFLQVEEDEEK
ncbi:MAG TPA: translation elongation factor 4 [Aminivibrio sp.]|jgi:GTP-binding protein LepA|uniref:translation elongation factor 4 n=1 Tax=Aminivibrio sp. TaxID=1872489 RepID=UPI002B200189|nr:translation elongation factor 4 [Aminivibrio sp.]MDD3514278.1 translation elongation factor 4 [Synergistaceae bacterium]MEA4952949.1 translation elongation factor 4 [Aminivibrio sp.]NCB15835.1 elongation factor 4 [Synergistales bacterium]HPF85170.1 translation elongation factor 4 [Aminivibrio sp.]